MSSLLDSLRFACTECGDCCRKKGEVRFDSDRFEAMANHLDLDPEVFRLRFEVAYREGEREPWVFDIPLDAACPLLDGDTCSVYPVRPRQCRTYPFWPDVTRDRQAWEEEGRQCPGIGRGPTWPRERVVAFIQAEAEADEP